jgi:sugar phosphate isomerase/epimerase
MLPTLAFKQPAAVVRKSGMRLKLVRSIWGVDGDLYDFFCQAKKDGKTYEGFEAGWVNLTEEQMDQLKRVQKDLGLDFTAMVFSDTPITPYYTVKEHVAEFKRQVEGTLKFLKPLHITSHSGKDTWTEEEYHEFFREIVEYTATLPVPVYHETHRGRVLYHPMVTERILKAFPSVLLTADLSHWVNVCQRVTVMDEPQGRAVLELVKKRTRHIHARVGYEHGPQVPDPRAPEYYHAVEAHERWWNEIFEDCESESHTGGAMKVITLVPEYGPPYYLHTLPFTNVPVANLNQVCDWAASRMQHKFLEQ